MRWGAEGVLFGRQFDLACNRLGAPLLSRIVLYMKATKSPSQENQWVGTNIAGWSEALYDQACKAASLALQDEQAGALNLAEAQFLSGLPAIPLFSVPEVVAVKSSACAAVGALWNFDHATCP